MLSVHRVHAFSDNYIWLIQSAHSRAVMIVDPGDANPVLAALEKHRLTPAAILVTHHHADHTGGIQTLCTHYDVPVIGPVNERIPEVTEALEAGEEQMLVDDFPPLTVLETPGHTPGHISYLVQNRLFCGDTLFAGGCGKLLGGTAAQLYQSLCLLRGLPDDTEIFCAHEYTEKNLSFAHQVEPDNAELTARLQLTHQQRRQDEVTVPSQMGIEKQTNPFLRFDQPSVKQAAEAYAGQRLESELEVFRALRDWKDHF